MRSWWRGHTYALANTVARLVRQPLSALLNVLVAGIALSLPLAGFTLLLSLQPLSGRLANEAEISVFLSLDAVRSDAEHLGPDLRALPGVASAQFVSRETALERLKAQPGMAEVIAALNTNPLPDAWVLHLKLSASETRSTAALQETLATQIRALPRVAYVQIDSDWLRRMEALMRFLRIGLSLLAVALGVAVVAVIFNTIRLQVLTQRDEIEVVRLMGATDAFIRRPFYYMGALQGLAGGALALALVLLVLLPLNEAAADFSRLYAARFVFSPPPALHLLAFLALTASLGWIAAILSVSRHLAGLRQR